MKANNDLPAGYRWATEDETENFVQLTGAIVVKRTTDSNGVPYTQDESDIAVPISEDRFWRPSEESRKSFYPNDPEPKLPVKNERGMYVVEEVIHHGDYRSVRRVEVYALTKQTIDGILISSAYGYEGIAEKYRERMLLDLQEGHVNRTIGWSTFRVL